MNALDDSGRTPLHNAIIRSHVGIVEMLLAANADVTMLDENQDSPLHTAVRAGDESIVKV